MVSENTQNLKKYFFHGSVYGSLIKDMIIKLLINRYLDKIRI